MWLPARSRKRLATVRVDTGELQGVVADGVVSFKGIPFAAPPSASCGGGRHSRRRSGQASARPRSSRASCMQGRGFGPPPGAGARAGGACGSGHSAPTPAAGARLLAPAPPPPAAAPAAQAPSEDCLYLNVWRPAEPAARNLPVMVWIYGGGFTGGSSSSPNTSGVGFAKQGVVLVAMNYRVGRFGFFAHPALSRERPEEKTRTRATTPTWTRSPPCSG